MALSNAEVVSGLRPELLRLTHMRSEVLRLTARPGAISHLLRLYNNASFYSIPERTECRIPAQ